MLITVQLFIGFGLLIGGAELLVRGAEKISLLFGVSPLLVGLTVVAYGTSAPEMAVNVSAIYEVPPRSSLVLGNIVGSNISNILLVLGLTAIVMPLVVPRKLVMTTLPFMVLVSCSVYWVALDDVISPLEGSIMFAAAILFSSVLIHQGRRQSKDQRAEVKGADSQSRMRAIGLNVLLLVVGLALLIYGADLLVEACIDIAKLLHVSELVIGLSIVAVGTSLPELATSIVAGIKGKRDLAVGNLVGSNIFNILLVLGLCAALSPNGVDVEFRASHFDIILMIVVAFACLPIFASDYKINRWEGVLLFAYYIAYIVYLYLSYAVEVTSTIIEYPLIYWVIPLVVVSALSLIHRFFMKETIS